MLALGRQLIEAGSIDESGLRAALSELGVLTLLCETCATTSRPAAYSPGSSDNCPECGSALTLVDPEASARLQQRAAAAARGGNPPEAKEEVSPRRREPQEGEESDRFVGRVLGGCQIDSKIANGGMGTVYKAVQLNLGRTVAVKVLAEELAKDKSFVKRFFLEARAAGQLSHGGIVHINDVGEQQGVFYFVMEFVDGRNLKDILQERKCFEVGETIDIMIQSCHALRHAHGRGIIHRDIKPENIMISRDGIVKLADLGLAKRMSEQSAGITHAGSILGTPYYMAPEQAKDFSKVDARSDIYSLGVTMYRMITSRVPFDGRSPIEVMIKALDGRKVPMRDLRPEVPPEVEALVERMMQKNPANRFQSVDEVLEELMRLDVALRSTKMALAPD